MISSNAKIGKGVLIKDSVTIHDGAVIGNRCIIEDGARIYEDCIIGSNTVIGPNTTLRPKTIVGNNCIFGTHSVSDGDNKIGDNTTVGAHCLIARYMNVGKNVFIGPGTIITNTKKITEGKHGTGSKTKGEWVVTKIGNNVRIGAHVLIFPGVSIGDNAFIEMGTYVRKSVPANNTLKSDIGRSQLCILDEY